MALLNIRSASGFALVCVLGAGLVMEKDGPSRNAEAPAAAAPAHLAAPPAEVGPPGSLGDAEMEPVAVSPVADAEPVTIVVPPPSIDRPRTPSGTAPMSEEAAQAALAADLGRALN